MIELNSKTEIKFETTINCSSCVSKVTETMNELVGQGNWDVDTDNPAKLLTVKSDSINVDEMTLKLAELGYAAQRI